jgi:hypothetical protein
MTNLQRAKNVGVSWAKSLFNDFVNHPEYKGTNFTWDNFATFASGIAETSCYMSFSPKVKNLGELEKVCKKSCYKECKMLIKKLKL